MQTPTWTKPALYGAAAGAIVLAAYGFGWAGWMTAGEAEQLADSRADSAVVEALAPICVEQARQDPEIASMLAGVGAARSYERGKMLMETGWATMPGAAEPDRDVANACWNALSAKL